MILETASPFSFPLTAEVLARLPRHNGLERYHPPGRFPGVNEPVHQRALRTSSGPLVVTARPAPGGLEISSDTSEARDWARLSFGLDLDPAPFLAAAAADPVLARAVTALSGLRPPLMEPWEAWVAAVLGQQVSLAFALQQITAVSRHYGGEVHGTLPDGNEASFPLHPTPEAIIEADPAVLLACKVSGRKAEYLKTLAEATLEGHFSGVLEMPLPEALAGLTALRGVGPWTARYWLATVGRLDSLAYGDAGLAAAYRQVYGAGAAPLETWGEGLGPARGWAYYYLIWYGYSIRGGRS